MRCPSLLHLKSKTEVQLKLTNRVSMSNRLSETQPRSRTSMFEQTVVKVSCLKLSIRILIQPIENFGHIKLTFASALPLTHISTPWPPNLTVEAFLKLAPRRLYPTLLKEGKAENPPTCFHIQSYFELVSLFSASAVRNDLIFFVYTNYIVKSLSTLQLKYIHRLKP